MTITSEQLKHGATLAKRSGTGPLIVNRFNEDDGSITWQLQQGERTAENADGAEVICGISGRDWNHARHTAEFFAWCATHVAELCVEVERLRASLAASEAECARLGAAACDAKWDLLP